MEKKDENLYIFIKDYVFNSPSAASDIVLGNSTSGWKKWKTKERIEAEVNKIGGFSWITSGKEIENYLTKENINKAYADIAVEDYQEEDDKAFNDCLNDDGKKKYKNKKSFARAIVEKMNQEDFKNENLYKKIKKLHETINKWNNLN